MLCCFLGGEYDSMGEVIFAIQKFRSKPLPARRQCAPGQDPYLQVAYQSVHQRMTVCEKEFDTYCFNNGQCILLEDIKEHHCKCKKGFYGPRCATPELVGRPVDEEQVVVILFCVTLLLIDNFSYVFYFICTDFGLKPEEKTSFM
uniref:EGF-like domain-containing protein n=1 Tax=Poecilia mexicana TaxID=48701 RepID=A0A3B3XEL0_9TELE